MKKIIFILFIFCNLLFAEEINENDSTMVMNVQELKSDLMNKITESEKQLGKKFELLQERLNEISETLSEQQEKLNELETKITANIQKISNLTNTQNNKITEIDKKIKEQSTNFNILKNELETDLAALNDSLGITSTKLSNSSAETTEKIGNIDESIDTKTFYIIIGSLILLLFIVIVFFVLNISIKKKTKSLDDNIVETRNKMEEEAVKLDAKLIEILEKQIQLNELKPIAKDEKIDHSIFIKVANEIQRMRTRIKHMPEDTKGIGALTNALRRLEEELNDNEYEVIDLTGQEYVDGLTTKARFIPSDQIETGKRIITKTIKPQVNYKNVLIQMSEIEITKGE